MKIEKNECFFFGDKIKRIFAPGGGRCLDAQSQPCRWRIDDVLAAGVRVSCGVGRFAPIQSGRKRVFDLLSSCAPVALGRNGQAGVFRSFRSVDGRPVK